MRTLSFPRAGLLRLMLALVFAAAAVLVAALASMSAHATAPGKNGQIAFRRWPAGAYEHSRTTTPLFLINPDGSGQGQLTHPAKHQDGLPDFAPDGSKLVFNRIDAHGNGQIWRVSANGSGPRRLYPTCVTGKNCPNTQGPSYSPNGALIAFAASTINASGIYVMSARGGHVRRLTSFKSRAAFVEDAAWSPDGKRLAFASTTKHGSALLVINANGRGMRQLTPRGLPAEGGRPDWSPDGTLIVFRSGAPRTGVGDYYTIHPDGTGVHKLTNLGPKAVPLGARFSPDGQSIVFAYSPSGGNPDVYTMHADGTGITPLTNTPTQAEDSVDWGPAA